ncbi:penicillin-binding transpeptidase domain-containing protein [Microvirga sp. W0021]|uniref:Penicillin-binding transpeptidase domain-containing protein n=1 Tax=Hohaiivirga grylli TaxID=3133970 RepID=A0ABV0BH57_9HYPH
MKRRNILIGFLCALAINSSLFFVTDAKALTPARGCTVILDALTGKQLVRKGDCDQRFSPASTFKMILALIGFDAGILQDQDKPVFKKKGKTVTPEIWLRDSILWYSFEVTKQLGQKRFTDYIRKLHYGNMDVSGDPGKNNSLTQSWIDSSLKISPDEQAAFVLKLFKCDLPVSKEACKKLWASLPQFQAADSWFVRGKTGTVAYRSGVAKQYRLRTGWFIGEAVHKDGTAVVFATTDHQPKNDKQPEGPRVRDKFLAELDNLVSTP